MNIVFCAAEAAPFAKVGGLGDVVGSLPKALAALGESVIVTLPYYGGIASEGYTITDTGTMVTVHHKWQTYPIKVLESTLPGSQVPIFFFAHPDLYGATTAVYPANDPDLEALRFEVFGLAVIAFLKQGGVPIDVMHVHDWHTANVAHYIRRFHYGDPVFQKTAIALSIHNMAYQGWTPEYNWLFEGFIHADAIIPVSPTYAREILTPEFGYGLEEVVRSRQDNLVGILNGIDTDLFNPQTDMFLAAKYGLNNFAKGKAVCKAALQQEVGLPVDPDVPVIAMVSRLVAQKGIDLMDWALGRMANLPAQFVFIGTGQPQYEDMLRQANTWTDNIRSIIGFNMALGQQAYGGADLFLMPSHFEPCGLGQLIALRYGTLPIVRHTGGLVDTVVDADADPVNGNGFAFTPYSADEMLGAMQRAITAYHDKPRWTGRVAHALSQDWSWTKSATTYRDVYRRIAKVAAAGSP